MVPEADHLALLASQFTLSHSTLTSEAKSLPHVSQWDHRAGRTDEFMRFDDCVREALSRMGLDLVHVLHSTLPDAADLLGIKGFLDAAPNQQKLALSAMRKQWFEDGNAVFDMLRPAVKFTADGGAHEITDRETIRSFVKGNFRNGYDLARWLYSWSDDSSLDVQQKIRARLEKKVPLTTSQIQLGCMLRGYYRDWCRVINNDPSMPANFYHVLLGALPSSPPEAPLVQIRTRLVNIVTDRNPILSQPNAVISALLEHAKLLKLKDTRPGADLNDDLVNVVTQEGKRAVNNNNCGFCSNFACSEGGEDGARCICKWDSKFPLTSIPHPTTRLHAVASRNYHKANPTIKTLKGVRIQINSRNKRGKSTRVGSLQVISEDSEAPAFESEYTNEDLVELFGDDITDADKFQEFLAAHDSDFEGVQVLGLGNLLGGGAADDGAESASSVASNDELAAKDAQITQLQEQLASSQLATTPRGLQTPAPPPTRSASTSGWEVSSALSPMTGQPQAAVPTPAISARIAQAAASALLPSHVGGGAHGSRKDDGKSTPLEHMAGALLGLTKENSKLLKLYKQKGTLRFLFGLLGKLSKSVVLGLLSLSTTQLVSLGTAVYYLEPRVRPYLFALLYRAKAAFKNAIQSQYQLARSRVLQTASGAAVLLLHRVIKSTAAESSVDSHNPISNPLPINPLPCIVEEPEASPLTSPTPPKPVDTPANGVDESAQPKGGDDTSATPDAAIQSDGTVKAKDGLMMVVHNKVGQLSGLVLNASPPISFKQLTDCFPALSDNGASVGSGCAKTTDGALPGTYKASDAGQLGVGDEGGQLNSEGSYLYALYREGKDGVVELVIRRLKHTPDLRLAMVFDEATEVYKFKRDCRWNDVDGRWFEDKEGKPIIALEMSDNKLGWYKVRPCYDKKAIAAALKSAKRCIPMKPIKAKVTKRVAFSTPVSADDAVESIIASPPAQVAPDVRQFQSDSDAAAAVFAPIMGVGMDKPVLRDVQGPKAPTDGVLYLRRAHIIHGHAGLRRLMATLLKDPSAKGKFTPDDVKQFASEGCGPCDSTKMRRPRISTATLKVIAPPGKRLVFDSVIYRVPQAQYGYVAGIRFVCSNPDCTYRFTIGVVGHSSAHTEAAIHEARARVRPYCGEVLIFKGDSHPSNKSRDIAQYMASPRPQSVALHLAPPGVHQGVGIAEVSFRTDVPVAMACLLQSPDLGEQHTHMAMLYAETAHNLSVITTNKKGLTPYAVFHGIKHLHGNPLHVFGSACKSLIDPDVRPSKYELAAKPAIYTGPPLHSDAIFSHGSTWTGSEYRDVHLGSIFIDESKPLARMKRDHPSHQPFGQGGDAKLAAGGKGGVHDLEKDVTLPVTLSIKRLPSDTPSQPTWLVWYAGSSRDGDVTAWVSELGEGKIACWPYDVKIGGYEHHTGRASVQSTAIDQIKHSLVKGLMLSPPCGPWSPLKNIRPGPPVLFSKTHPDGIPNDDGTIPQAVLEAMAVTEFTAKLIQTALDHGKSIIYEMLVDYSKDSIFHVAGLEEHSTPLDTSPMKNILKQNKLSALFFDQGGVGAATRKPSVLLTTEDLYGKLQRRLGFSYAPDHKGKLVGKDEDGNYLSHAAAKYSPEICFNLAQTMVEHSGSKPSWLSSTFEAYTAESVAASEADSGDVATVDLHPVGKRVEVFWEKDGQWFAAVVIDSYVKSARIGNENIKSRCIQVRYEADDEIKTHYLHNTQVREADSVSPDLEGDIVLTLFNERPQIEDERIKEWLSVPINTTKKRAAKAAQAIRAAKVNGDSEAAITAAEKDASIMTAALKGMNELNAIKGYYDLTQKQQPRQAYVGSRLVDLGSNSILTEHTLYVLTNGKVTAAASIDPENAHAWHTPSNFKDYQRSPQRMLWRTAMELKMDEYEADGAWTLVKLDELSDNEKSNIINSLWVFKIKTDGTKNRKFVKLNPRCCAVGTGMDRKEFHAHAETMRMISFKAIIGIGAACYTLLVRFSFDVRNCFQATRREEGSTLHMRQPPEFKKYGPKGEELVCRLNCAYQGTIDAAHLADQRLNKLFILANSHPLVSDPQTYLYHNGPLKGTSASLLEIITSIDKAVDSPPGHPPIAFAIFGKHVDDGLGLATGNRDLNKNRFLSYLKDTVKVEYDLTYNGWQRSLGFNLVCDDVNETITMTAPGAIDEIISLGLKGVSEYQPQQPMMSTIDSIEAGEVPALGDPMRDTYLADQALCQSLLGKMMHFAHAYYQVQPAVNKFCAHVHSPSVNGTLKGVRHMLMYLKNNPIGNTFGGKGCVIIPSGVIQPPFAEPMKPGYLHVFSDGSMGVDGSSLSYTGGVGFFARGALFQNTLRQHTKAPNSHSVEVVAASSNLYSTIMASDLLQEVHVQIGAAVPFYLDSSSTHAISHSEMAPKKSLWQRRRSAVVVEGAESKTISPLLITDEEMVADAMSKYVPYAKWKRMMAYFEDAAEPIHPRVKPVSKMEFLAAIARRQEHRPWPNDEVTLSHGVSRGVNGMSKAEVMATSK